jgi:positive regulator of sigma E activity
VSTSHIHQLATVSTRSGCSLQIELRRSGGCGYCSGKSGCGLFVIPGRRSLRLDISGYDGIETGQTVRFGLPVAGLGRLALVFYLTIPLATFGGALLASASTGRWTDLVAIIGAAAGFVVGCAALKLYDSHAGRYWLERVEIQPSSEHASGDT